MAQGNGTSMELDEWKGLGIHWDRKRDWIGSDRIGDTHTISYHTMARPKSDFGINKSFWII